MSEDRYIDRGDSVLAQGSTIDCEINNSRIDQSEKALQQQRKRIDYIAKIS